MDVNWWFFGGCVTEAGEPTDPNSHEVRVEGVHGTSVIRWQLKTIDLVLPTLAIYRLLLLETCMAL